jgi:hypothetical protein
MQAHAAPPAWVQALPPSDALLSSAAPAAVWETAYLFARVARFG